MLQSSNETVDEMSERVLLKQEPARPAREARMAAFMNSLSCITNIVAGDTCMRKKEGRERFDGAG